jgi:hypothetical protein
MKVFHITQLLEVDKIEPTLTGGDTSVDAPKDVTSVKIEKTQVLGSDGKPQFKVVDQAGKTLFVGTEEAANAKYDEINKSIKTPAAATPEKPMAAGVRDGTPTSDQLTARERRTIAKGGSITRTVGGQKITFNAKNIADADALSKVKLPGMPGDTKPKDAKSAAGKGGDVKAMAEDMKKGIAQRFLGYAKKIGLTWFGGAVTNAIVKAIEISAVTEAHNAYFTSLAQLGDAKTPQDRKKILDEMENIRKTQIVGPMTDLFLGSAGTALLGGSALAVTGIAVGGVLGGPATGFVSWILPVLIGGALLYGAYEGTIMIAKKIPMPGIGGGQKVYEFFYQKFDETWLTPGDLRNYAAQNGSADVLDFAYGLLLDPVKKNMSPLTPTPPPGVDAAVGAYKGIKSIMGDSVVREKDEEETMSKSGGSAKSAIMSDPELKKLFLIGKAEMKKQERDAANTAV